MELISSDKHPTPEVSSRLEFNYNKIYRSLSDNSNLILHKANEILINNTPIRKSMQFIQKFVSIVDLKRFGEIKKYHIINGMQKTVNIFEVYDSYKNLIFWSNYHNLCLPLTDLLSKMCFTITDLSDALEALENWKIINLFRIADQIGGNSHLFLFVKEIGYSNIIRSIASLGLIIVLGKALSRLCQHGLQHYQSSDADGKNKIYPLLKGDLISIASSGTDLMNASLPLLFTLNLPTVLSLGLLAKGTGVISFYLRQTQNQVFTPVSEASLQEAAMLNNIPKSQ